MGSAKYNSIDDEIEINNNINIINYGRGIIKDIVRAIDLLEKSTDITFQQAITSIFKVNGRVIITGIGKSGLIGKKIAATMASTGTPAHFVHPAEASHGDLGMLTADDLLLAISNSGETRELTDILLFAKNHNLPIIAITRDAGSTLGKLADIVLELPNSREACPLERAPTTSTTNTLVLGDAIAMTLMKLRNFQEVDFVNLHPGGKLGAMLLSVENMLQMNDDSELPLVKEHADMREIVLTITRGLRGHAGVLNKEGKLIGIISDGDLRRAYNRDMLNQSAATVMTPNPKTVTSTMRAYEVRELLKKHEISAVFVVDQQNRPIGLLHLQELLRL